MNGFKREDDFEQRRKHLEKLTDAQLKEKFWRLTQELIDPMLELARTHTSPSIERSVLLRMGVSSLDANPLVQMAIDRSMIGYGVGHILYLASIRNNIDLKTATKDLLEGKYWDEIYKELVLKDE